MDLRKSIELNRELDLSDPRALDQFIVFTKVQLLELQKNDRKAYDMYIESLEAYFHYRRESGRREEIVYKDDQEQAFEDLNVKSPIEEIEEERIEEIKSAATKVELTALSDDEFNALSVRTTQVVTTCTPVEEVQKISFSGEEQATHPHALSIRSMMRRGMNIEEIIDKRGTYTYSIKGLLETCVDTLVEIDEVADIKKEDFNTKYTR
jgi:hypothetical protein